MSHGTGIKLNFGDSSSIFTDRAQPRFNVETCVSLLYWTSLQDSHRSSATRHRHVNDHALRIASIASIIDSDLHRNSSPGTRHGQTANPRIPRSAPAYARATRGRGRRRI